MLTKRCKSYTVSVFCMFFLCKMLFNGLSILSYMHYRNGKDYIFTYCVNEILQLHSLNFL